MVRVPFTQDRCRGCAKRLPNEKVVRCLSCDEYWEIQCTHFTPEKKEILVDDDIRHFVCMFCKDDDEDMILYPRTELRRRESVLANEIRQRLNEEADLLTEERDMIVFVGPMLQDRIEELQ